MNSLHSFLGIVVAVLFFFACSSAGHTAYPHPKHHSLDSLPTTIIESEKDADDSDVFIDTTSSISQKEFLFSFTGTYLPMSGSGKIGDNKSPGYKNELICHIDFQ